MFDKCNKTEAWLAQLGVQREYHESVSYDMLIDEWNVINHGRPEQQNRVDAAIESYADMMQKGSPAPAVILRRTEGRYEVLDGCQRLMANELCDSRHCAAYIITCSYQTAQKIRIAANLRGNTQAPVPRAWVISQMVKEFIIGGDDSAKEVSTVLGVPVNEVLICERRERVRARVASGYLEHMKREAPGFDDGKLDAIAKFSEREDFEGRAGKFTLRAIDSLFLAKLTNGIFSQTLSEFFSPKRTPAKDRGTQLSTQMLKIITENAAIQSRINGPAKRGELNRVQDAMKALLTTIKNYKKVAKECPLDHRPTVTQLDEQWAEAGRLMRECVSTQMRTSVNSPHGPFAR
jgi:hypothetical protein